MIILRYVGKINDLGDPSFLPGAPARDLTQDDIDGRHLDVAVLVASGLYEAIYEDDTTDLMTATVTVAEIDDILNDGGDTAEEG